MHDLELLGVVRDPQRIFSQYFDQVTKQKLIANVVEHSQETLPKRFGQVPEGASRSSFEQNEQI